MDGMIMPDGFKRHIRRILGLKPKMPAYNILIIGATNRANDLDPALAASRAGSTARSTSACRTRRAARTSSSTTWPR